MAEIAKPKEFNNVRKRVLKLKTNIVVTSERIKVVILSVFLVRTTRNGDSQSL